MTGLRFQSPLWLLLLVPLVLLGLWAIYRQRRVAVLYSDVRLLLSLPNTWALRVKRAAKREHEVRLQHRFAAGQGHAAAARIVKRLVFEKLGDEFVHRIDARLFAGERLHRLGFRVGAPAAA